MKGLQAWTANQFQRWNDKQESMQPPDCNVCNGKGWYAQGETDKPQQVQCEACFGTGVASNLNTQAANTVSVKRSIPLFRNKNQ